MTRRKTLLLSGIAVITMGTIAHANPAADTNKDGVISRAEFMAAAQAKFDRSDLNGDGFISKDEREGARAVKEAERRTEHFNRIDTNGDGVISRDEFENEADMRHDKRSDRRDKHQDMRQQRMEELKTQADTNGDGVVSDAERQAMRENFEGRRGARRERIQEFRDRRQDRNSESRSIGEGPVGPRGDDPLSRVDTNGDDLISSQEFLAGAEQMFEHMDANGDGQLEKGEGRRHKRPGRGR